MGTLKFVILTVMLSVTGGIPAQLPPSIAISEATINAGKSSSIEIHVPHPVASPYPLIASVSYVRAGVFSGAQPMFESFGCGGDFNALVQRNGQFYLVMSCNVSEQMKGGEYRPAGPVRVQAGNGEVKEYPALNLPIITVKELPPPPPPPPATFPDLEGARLLLDVSQSFSDGAIRAEKVLTELSAHFPSGIKDNKQNRAYLLAQAQQTKIIVKLTRARYEKAKLNQGIQGVLPASVMFEDLTLRLDDVIKALGGGLFDPPVTAELAHPRFILVQLPKTSDQIDAQAGVGLLNANVAALTAIIVDARDVFERIGLTTQEQFTWSITTNPVGAKIFYRRLHHSEDQWVGQTNLTNQSLGYARWTFRFDWDGCSVEQTPNPYRQSTIHMVADKKDCKSK